MKGCNQKNLKACLKLYGKANSFPSGLHFD